MDIKSVFETFKTHVAHNKMSLLVGAGVSMSVSKMFMNWYDLLQDMVVYLFRPELEAAGVVIIEHKSHYCHYTLTGTDYKPIIYNIIDRYGVLEIPSMYWKRVGMRESVESYIESHIPTIDIDNRKISLFGEEESLHNLPNIDFLPVMLGVGWNSVFTTNYDKLLYYGARMTSTSWEEYSRAKDLSLCDMSNIIVKLHGDLNTDSRDFRFDQDLSRRYILTKEDYEEYPAKHEAFMQLMRITLLTNCFCLVGFSGKDANFIAWIKWVRDILESVSATETEKKEIKIFFIDCFDKPLDRATQQFFDNYRIYRIVLPQQEVLEKLRITQSEADFEDSNSWRRYLMKRFFEYVTPEKIQYSDENAVRHTNTLWSKAYNSKIEGHKTVITVDEENSRRLIDARPFMRIVRSDYYQKEYIYAIDNRAKLSELEAQLALSALEQMFTDINRYGELKERIRKSLTSKDDLARLQQLEMRADTLSDPYKSANYLRSDFAYYERCLRYAFTFRYKELFRALDSWTPKSSEYIAKKAVLMSPFRAKYAGQMITSKVIDEWPVLDEQYRLTQIANCLSGNYPAPFSTSRFSHRSDFSLTALADFFFRKSLEGREQIVPHGQSEAKVPIKQSDALRSMQFLIEAPTMLQLNMYSMINHRGWYEVAHALYEDYPYPVLFYTSTLNDEKMLKRLAQDYAYSDRVRPVLPDIVRRMFKVLVDEDIPLNFWQTRNYCVILTELVKAVPCAVWQDYLQLLWEKFYLPNIKEHHAADGMITLLRAALPMCDSTKLVASIVNGCLNSKEQDVNVRWNFIDILYYVRFARFRTVPILGIKETIDQYIAHLESETGYNILLNINPLLTEEQKEAIASTIPAFIETHGVNANSINAMMFFTRNDANARNFVRESIIRSRSLWDNGIGNNGTSFSEEHYIDLINHDKHLEWSKDEANKIFELLVKSEKQVIEHLEHYLKFPFHDAVGLLYQMMRFIELHKDDLPRKEADDVYLEINNAFEKLTTKLSFTLYSDDSKSINLGMRLLTKMIISSGVEANRSQLNKVLDRVLFRMTESLALVLDYIRYYVENFIKTREEADALPRLQQILEMYDLDLLRQLDQDVYLCSLRLIAVAIKLQKLGINSESVQKWIAIKNSNRFNWVFEKE